MKKCKLIVIRLFMVVLMLAGFASHSYAALDNLAITIDASKYDSTELEVKKALIHAALHYQWNIVEHGRYSMLWDYRGRQLRLEITGAVIKVYKTEDDEFNEMNPKWLPRIKKLTLRQLANDAEVRKAEALIK